MLEIFVNNAKIHYLCRRYHYPLNSRVITHPETHAYVNDG